MLGVRCKSMDTSNNSYEQLYKKNCRWMWWKIFLKEDLERSPTLVILTIKKKLKFKCSDSESSVQQMQVQLRSQRLTSRNLLLWAHSMLPELHKLYSCISTTLNPYVLSSVWSKLTLQWFFLSPHQVPTDTCASTDTPVMPDWAEIQMDLSQVLCGSTGSHSLLKHISQD